MTSMNYSAIFDMIESMGFPAAYNHFPNDTGKAPPYICFYYPASNDTMADDTNYVKVESLYIELYTDAKDFKAEHDVEEVLRENHIAYSRSETYLDTEKLYLQLYTMQIVIVEEEEYEQD